MDGNPHIAVRGPRSAVRVARNSGVKLVANRLKRAFFTPLFEGLRRIADGGSRTADRGPRPYPTTVEYHCSSTIRLNSTWAWFSR